MAQNIGDFERCDRSDHDHGSLEEARACVVFVFEDVPAGAERLLVAGDPVVAGQVAFRWGDYQGWVDAVVPFVGVFVDVRPGVWGVRPR